MYLCKTYSPKTAANSIILAFFPDRHNSRHLTPRWAPRGTPINAQWHIWGTPPASSSFPIQRRFFFQNGTPIYVQSPGLMGNSLAAIGARHQMWESTSDRLSSSSDSCGGPVVSFGQALRSAMETRDDPESLGTSSQDLADVDEQDVADSSRKSSVSAETAEKLCTIPREKGLDAQDFRCAMCRKTIGGSTFSKFEWVFSFANWKKFSKFWKTWKLQFLNL